MTQEKTIAKVELKPCLFCGGEARIERQGTPRVSMMYICEDCGCTLETGETGDKHDMWNRRSFIESQPEANQTSASDHMNAVLEWLEDRGIKIFSLNDQCAITDQLTWYEQALVEVKKPESQPEAGGEHNRDLIYDELAKAYVAGCQAVHENWQPDTDPDFKEAGYDYAATQTEAVLLSLRPSPPQAWGAATPPQGGYDAPPVEGERDDLLASLLRYSHDLYGVAVKAGIPAKRMADFVQHFERAFRRLHALTSPPQTVTVTADDEIVKRVQQWLDDADRQAYEDCDPDGPGENPAFYEMAEFARDDIRHILGLLSATPVAPQPPEISFRVMTMKTSNGADYFVMMKCRDRELSLWSSRQRYQMEYHLAEMNWLIGQGEKPDILAFDEATHPNLYPNTHPADASAAPQEGEG